MLWQEYIPYLFPILILAQDHYNDAWFGNNQNIHYWEGKSDFPKLCFPQNEEIYMISPIYFSNHDILHVYATPIL